MFETQGGVDWSELPAGGTRMKLAGHEAWRWIPGLPPAAACVSFVRERT